MVNMYVAKQKKTQVHALYLVNLFFVYKKMVYVKFLSL